MCIPVIYLSGIHTSTLASERLVYHRLPRLWGLARARKTGGTHVDHSSLEAVMGGAIFLSDEAATACVDIGVVARASHHDPVLSGRRQLRQCLVVGLAHRVEFVGHQFVFVDGSSRHRHHRHFVREFSPTAPERLCGLRVLAEVAQVVHHALKEQFVGRKSTHLCVGRAMAGIGMDNHAMLDQFWRRSKLKQRARVTGGWFFRRRFGSVWLFFGLGRQRQRVEATNAFE